MLSMLVRNKVKDFDHWKNVFDDNLDTTGKSGLTFSKMWRSYDDPNTVWFILKVEDHEKVEAFVNDPASAEVGRQAGVIDGEIFYVEDVE